MVQKIINQLFSGMFTRRTEEGKQQTNPNRTLRVLLVSLSAVLVGILLSREIALAECKVTATSGDDDVILCGSPDDSDGIYTSSGHDTVTVESGVRVSSAS